MRACAAALGNRLSDHARRRVCSGLARSRRGDDMNGIIYLAYCREDHCRGYVGKTEQGLEARRQEHLRSARGHAKKYATWKADIERGKECYPGDPHIGEYEANLAAYDTNSGLRGAIRRCGSDAFQWMVLEDCPVAMLDDRERYWIERLGTEWPSGYNLTGGNGMTRKKIRAISQHNLHKKLRRLWARYAACGILCQPLFLRKRDTFFRALLKQLAKDQVCISKYPEFRGRHRQSIFAFSGACGIQYQPIFYGDYTQ